MKIFDVEYIGLLAVNSYSFRGSVDPKSISFTLKKELASDEKILNGWSELNAYKNREINKEYTFDGDPDKVKMYYFIPGTKFDRDYFKRLYPDLVYTRKLENVDIIFYDQESLNKYL